MALESPIGLLRVNHVTLTARRELLLFLDQRTPLTGAPYPKSAKSAVHD
jgi:hypothetical protein